MGTTWYFVRHCQSQANRAKLLSGQLDSPLSWYGYLQCLSLARQVRPLGVGRVLSSDLSRALRTARFLNLASGAKLIVSTELRERSVGVFQGLPKEDLVREGVLRKLRSWDFRPPGGESRMDVAYRVSSWLTTMEEKEPTLVVTHHTVLSIVLDLVGSSFCGSAKGISNGDIKTFSIPPGFWETAFTQLSEQRLASNLGFDVNPPQQQIDLPKVNGQ